MQGVGAGQALERPVGLAAGVQRLAEREQEGALVSGREAVQGLGLAAETREDGFRLGRAIVQGLLIDQVVVGLGVVGPELERAPVAARRLFQSPLGAEHIGQIVQGAGIVGPKIQDPARAGAGVFDPLQPPIGRAEVQPGVGERGPDGESPLIGRGGLGQVALPKGEVPRVEPAFGPGGRRVARTSRRIALTGRHVVFQRPNAPKRAPAF